MASTVGSIVDLGKGGIDSVRLAPPREEIMERRIAALEKQVEALSRAIDALQSERIR